LTILECPRLVLPRLLRSINDFSETVAGLPYSLWALPACSGWLGWLVYLVGLWGAHVFMSLSLKMSRSTIRVYVAPPSERQWAHGAACAPLQSPQ
jgi:hypothetical protein